MYSIAKEFTFDAAHRLQNHLGKCRNLHGHTYKVVASVSAPGVSDLAGASDEGMVLDFEELKAWWGRWDNVLDHAVILSPDDPLVGALQPFGMRMHLMPEDMTEPTAESLAAIIQRDFAAVMFKLLGPCQVAVRVYETPTSWAQVG